MLALWGTGDVTRVNPAQWQLGKAPALEPELYKQLTSWKDGWLQNYTKQKQCFLTPHGITEYCKHTAIAVNKLHIQMLNVIY